MSQRLDTPAYYMPYESEDDTGTDDDDDESYDDSDLPEFEDPRIRREEDPRYALIRTAGPNLNTSQEQLKYMEHAPGASYDNSTNITDLKNLVYLNPPKTTVTSLFSVKASNRDRRVYPSPFNFEIKLPRVYKNITKFQLVQLSFPNNKVENLISSPAFLSSINIIFLIQGFPQECISCCTSILQGGAIGNTMAMAEQGKVNSLGQQFLTTLTVPNGLYTNQKLATELTNQANNTPPFNLISYSTFKEIFETTRDVLPLFNEPGDLFFSKLTGGQVYRSFSKETIMNTYYTQKHIDSLLEINDKVSFNAYYYPVLKELVSTEYSHLFLTLNNYSFSEVQELVLQNFAGLDSEIYYELCSTNKGALDSFRRGLTFELKNVNKYIWSFDQDNSQFRVIHNSLHTSIERDIQKNFDTLLNNNLTLNNLTLKSFNEIKKQLPLHSLILKHLESNLSTKIGEYHFQPDYKYLGGIEHITSTSTFTVQNLDSDSDFTSMFKFTGIFGNQYGNYSGVKFTFSTFLDYHSTVSSYYNLVTSSKSTISSIHKDTYDEHHKYVSTKYSLIFPENYIANRSYNNNTAVGTNFVGNQYFYSPGMTVNSADSSCSTLISSINSTCNDVCTQTIKREVMTWYGCLPVDQVVNSLQYALGIVDISLSTSGFASTILSLPTGTNNYFLQINNTEQFNNMDIAMDEDYSVTNDTTGQIKLMYAKILTGGLGSGEIAQTVIQNPVIFENPLGKLDKLKFKIYYDDENLTPGWLVVPFEAGFNNWDATFQIDEEVGYADRNTGFSGNIPTIPIPSNPDALQYMALTSTNNPNNKSFP